jgi:hypothetical protein
MNAGLLRSNDLRLIQEGLTKEQKEDKDKYVSYVDRA